MMNAAGILAGGTALIRSQPRAVAIWGLLYVVGCGLLTMALWPWFGQLAQFQQQAITARSAGLPPPGPLAGFFATIALFEIALLILFVAIFAAAVRAVAMGGSDRWAFLRLGGDELRLIGLGVLLVLLAFGVTIAAVLVMVLLAAALGAIFGTNGAGGAALLVIPLIVGLYGVIIWAQVRLSLAGALTVLRGRIVMREAWRLTRGRFWTLFGVYLLIGIAYFAVSLLVLAIVSPGMLTMMANPGDQAAMLAQQQAMLANPFTVRTVIGWTLGAVVMTVGVGFTFGAVATAAIGFDEDLRDRSDAGA